MLVLGLGRRLPPEEEALHPRLRRAVLALQLVIRAPLGYRERPLAHEAGAAGELECCGL